MSTYTNLAAANAADDDRFLTSVDMAVGEYTLDETTIGTQGARHVTVTVTAGDTADTMGTVTIVGRNLAGDIISEVITPVADSEVEGSKWFASLISATGAGWVIDGAEGNEDAIEIGYGADICVLEGAGRLEAIVVNTTAASTIVVADNRGGIATLAASIPVGSYEYGVDVTDLTVDVNGASNITLIHSDSLPQSYALA